MVELISVGTEKTVMLGGSHWNLWISDEIVRFWQDLVGDREFSTRSHWRSQNIHQISLEIAVFSPNLGRILNDDVILGQIFSRNGGFLQDF